MTIITLPPHYKPSAKEEYMNDMQLAYFKQKLLDWRTELMKGSENTLQDLKETNLNEADANDRASSESDQSLELRTRDRARKLIKKINQALDRIEAQERHERKEKNFAEE